MGRSAQAVDLQCRFVGDSVGRLVRRLRHVFNFGARWIRTATGATVTTSHWRGSIHINSFLKKLRDRKSYRRSSRVCGRTIGLPTRRYHQRKSDFVVRQFPQCECGARPSV
jgi:hypothetical protein